MVFSSLLHALRFPGFNYSTFFFFSRTPETFARHRLPVREQHPELPTNTVIGDGTNPFQLSRQRLIHNTSLLRKGFVGNTILSSARHPSTPGSHTASRNTFSCSLADQTPRGSPTEWKNSRAHSALFTSPSVYRTQHFANCNKRQHGICSIP